MSWIGGVGIGVTYLYDVSSSGAIVAPANYTTTALGTNPTRITLNDKTVKTYTVVVKATNGVGTVSSATSGSVTTISSLATFSGYQSTVTNGSYRLFAYTNPTTINNAISLGSTVTLHVFMVGGGGTGTTTSGGGGGGGGGVIMTQITSTQADFVSITVAAGSSATQGTVSNGNSTIISFTNQTAKNQTAKGGAAAGNGATPPTSNMGCGGGGSTSGQAGSTGTQGGNGAAGISTMGGGGGGGGGNGGGDGGYAYTVSNANGGSGININTSTLPALLGSTYANFKWAGGGGAWNTSTVIATGGSGGGAGGGAEGAGIVPGYNTGTNGNGGIAGTPGANTGGGGGASKNGSGAFSRGASGICIIGILSTSVSV